MVPTHISSGQNMMLFYVRVYTGRSLISGLEVMLDATTFVSAQRHSVSSPLCHCVCVCIL